MLIVETIALNLLLLTLIVIVGCVSIVSGQFKGLFTDITVPDCIQSNGRRGKCYMYTECGQFYKKSVQFAVCEINLDQRFLTVCCDELPSTRYSPYRTEQSWMSSITSPSSMATDFECGVRIANRDILEVISSGTNGNGGGGLGVGGDSNDQGQLLLQALTYIASRDGTHPWMASLWYKNVSICGASIINRRALLTSAHCFQFSRDPADYTITMGSIHLSQGRRSIVKRLMVHPGYRPPAIINDIAIIILDNQLRFDWRVNPVCLASNFMGDSQLKVQKATVIGFGNNKSNPRQTLQEITVPLISSIDCSAIYSKFRQFFPLGVDKEFICAGNLQGKDACTGDSGGPMMIKYYTKMVQIGIVTFGLKCSSPDYPSVYTSVAYHFRWIQQNAG